jgi:hypothetical protein
VNVVMVGLDGVRRRVPRPGLRRAALRMALALTVAAVAACGGKDDGGAPVATPTVTLNKTRASLGSPLEVTYKFTVAPGTTFDRDYRAFVHFVNAEDEQMWTDDHDPPRPTRTWKAGETVEYTRTVFVPSYPYNGRASVVLGLYDPKTNTRLTLGAKDRGLKAYEVAGFELVPQGENVFLIYKDETWHAAEDARENGSVSWRWSRRTGVIAFRNPKRDATFYLQLDGRPDLQPVKPQTVTVRIGTQEIDRFVLADKEPVLRKVAIPAAAFGAADTVELSIDAGSTFIPKNLPNAGSQDGRELGLRVFHAFVEPK